jgi:hypothetical protein
MKNKDAIDELSPVNSEIERTVLAGWTERLVLFLRAMSVLSMTKGLYHWALVCGFIGERDGFFAHTTSWQSATVFFAVIDLVAAVGMWLAAPWGAVVWLTSGVSLIVIDVFFNHIFGDQTVLVVVVGVLILAYLGLAIQAAREHPQ